jgi:outer membrane protein TolC
MNISPLLLVTAFLSPALALGEDAAPPAVSTRAVWTMDDVTRLALENNPDVLTALANVAAARAVVGEAASVYLPHLSAQGQTLRTTLPQPSAGLTPNLGQNDPYTWGSASFRQTLFDFGQGLEAIRAGQAGRRAEQRQLEAVKNQIRLGVEEAFDDVELSEKLVGVAQRGVDRFQETQRDAALLVKTGVRPPFDLSQANVELVTAQLELIKARNSRDLAKVALLTLIGVRDRIDFELSESTVAAASIAGLDLDRLIADGVQYRPEIGREEAALAQADSTLNGARVSLLPTVQAQGWYGGFEADYPESLRKAWGLGLGASWNFFDGWFTPSRIRELAARRDAARAQYEKERLAVVQDVSNAYLNLGRARQNLDVSEQALGFAKENLDLGQKRYKAGVGTILELLIAETSEFNAEAEELQAVYGLSVAAKELETAVNLPLEKMK